MGRMLSGEEGDPVYQALYRKYRPQTFDEVVGQSGVTQTLKAQLAAGRLSHAYLFTGSRGTGKTSCAKILAKAVNCEHPEGGNPCNRCTACRAIDSGSCMDVLEIDAASNNGVDNVRSLRDDAIYPPAEVKMRVYIIDEVHMLSISAFNALLKLIEEPPAHLLFILATTELHKVPATILSRCQRFSFRRLTPEDIGARINECAFREGIEIDSQAIAILSRLADGAMRDGMSLLDQCAGASQGRITAESIYSCLGLAGQQRSAEMLACVAAGDKAKLLDTFAALYASGKDLGAMIDELTALCRDLLIMKTARESAGSLISGVCDPAILQSLAPQFTAEQLLRMTELLQQTASGFNRSANRRIDAELCLLRLCDERLDTDPRSILARLSKLEAQIGSGARIVPLAQTPAPVIEPTKEPEKPVEEPSIPTQEPSMPDTDFWNRLCDVLRPQLSISDQWLFSPASRGKVSGALDGGSLIITVADAFTKGMAEKLQEPISRTAAQLLGKPVRVRFTVRGEASSADGFDQLKMLGQTYPDIVHIQD